ncbi:Rne/Rng family ribonuclease [Clostridium thermarum]|uniref:Rne/Rng family ribonuclease n=1 Tax=Clostridium thermarum TaxID=1716543 RepID=UPI0013D46F05|nr:ribonuclease E/G [Clostridium thermarum]
MKEIFIERGEDILRIAIKKGNKLIDCFMEEETKGPYPGQIYKAVVKNIIPAIKSAFLDIGLEKNAYLYLEGKYEKKKIKKGDELIVEVVKEELGDKGAKVTTAFSLPGRYCVLVTDSNDISFSSKITSAEYKKDLLAALAKPQEVGIKIRTAAASVTTYEINEEIKQLYNVYSKIVKEHSYKIKPGLLHSDGGVIARVLRDNVDESISKIVTDNSGDYEIIKDFIKDKQDISAKVELYSEHRSLFEFYNIEKEVLSLRKKRVNLTCGGYIIIEKTEAMHVIDVNSGRNVASNRREDTAFSTNCEAAEACAKQIRLRNLSGIIIIDFIDMEEKSHKEEVFNILKRGFEEDKNKTIVYPFTELGLIQIARRRRGKPAADFIDETCSECSGYGKKLRFSYICNLIRNEMLKLEDDSTIKDIYIQLSNYYRNAVEKDLQQFLKFIGAEGKNIYLKYSEDLESFKMEPVIFASQREAVERYRL